MRDAHDSGKVVIRDLGRKDRVKKEILVIPIVTIVAGLGVKRLVGVLHSSHFAVVSSLPKQRTQGKSSVYSPYAHCSEPAHNTVVCFAHLEVPQAMLPNGNVEQPKAKITG